MLRDGHGRASLTRYEAAVFCSAYDGCSSGGRIASKQNLNHVQTSCGYQILLGLLIVDLHCTTSEERG